MMRTQKILLVLSLLLGIMPIMRADETNGVQSFTVSVPDRIVQGMPFSVVFTLKATHWSKVKPKQGNDFLLMGVKYDKTSHDTYTVLQSQATCITSRSGSLQLPRMVAIVDGEEVLSEDKTVEVTAHPQYGEEMSYAHDWLVRNGKNPDSLCLELRSGENDLLMFGDRYHPCFVVMARKAVWPLVGLPVLAYSTNHLMSNHQEDPGNYEKMLMPFRLQIKQLKAQAQQEEAPSLPYKRAKESLSPMLGELKWGQAEPYNVMTEALTKRATLIGCVPLAMAMVMNRHQWPAQGSSHAYYKLGGTVYLLDFSKCQPQWTTYRNNYDKKDAGAVQNLSELLVTIGLAVDADFKKEETSANFGNVKRALCNNLGYSARLNTAENLTAAETQALLWYELDHGRPCIVSHGSHAFVCDGYKDDFMHFNLGWNGQFSGYYRLVLGRMDNPDILVKKVIYGIEPLTKDMAKEVSLTAPGTLETALSQTDKEQTTHLTVHGPLNSADVRLLRKMAGVPDEHVFGSWRGGSLTSLNLADATIVTDTLPYLTRKARGKWTHWEEVGGRRTERTYDFEHLDLESWKQLQADMADVAQRGVSYTRTDDNRYWAHYSCQPDTIGAFMFNDCSSLRSIVLPATVRKVGDYAFGNCSLMQAISLPSSVEEVGWTPFNNCTSLEKIEMPGAAKCKDAAFKNCSPALSGITRY